MSDTLKDAVQMAEVKKDIEFIKTTVKDIKKNQDEKLATKHELNDVSKRVSKIEKDRDWIVRLIVGAVITAVLTTVVITSR